MSLLQIQSISQLNIDKNAVQKAISFWFHNMILIRQSNIGLCISALPQIVYTWMQISFVPEMAQRIPFPKLFSIPASFFLHNADALYVHTMYIAKIYMHTQTDEFESICHSCISADLFYGALDLNWNTSPLDGHQNKKVTNSFPTSAGWWWRREIFISRYFSVGSALYFWWGRYSCMQINM